MNAPTRIYQDVRPAWERRLMGRVYGALIEHARTQPGPIEALGAVLYECDAADWASALSATMPHVPEQFRHLWTQERARDLLEWALSMAMHRLRKDLRGRLIDSIPALAVQP